MATLELVLCRLVTARPTIAIARPKRLSVPRSDAPDHGQATEPLASKINSFEFAGFPAQAPHDLVRPRISPLAVATDDAPQSQSQRQAVKGRPL